MVPHRDLKLFHRLRMDLRGAATTSNPRKSQIFMLRFHLKDHPFLHHYLRLAKDPTFQFGITSEDVRRSRRGQIRAILRGPVELLHLFAEDRCLMHMRAPLWGAYLAKLPSDELRETANCILDKNLRARLSPSTLNEALRSLGYPSIRREG